MTVLRIKGLKRYRVKGKWYAYHRRSGTRLKSEFGTAEFIAELAVLERNERQIVSLPGTLGALFASYRASPAFLDLAAATRSGYSRMMNLLKPIDAMPLIELTAQFIARLRDQIAEKHGRRQANYVMAVISVACEHGKEHGAVRENPVKGVKRIRRARCAPMANRPWTMEECRTVLDELPAQLKVPVALAMFTGLRKGDALGLTKAAMRDGRLWKRTNKTGHELSIPIHPELASILASAPKHAAITVAATTHGTPWTESGFNSSFIKAIAGLKNKGKVGDGLTFHGLRHTVGTLLIEAGFDIDTVRRWLGQKTLAMAIHYTQTADTSRRMIDVIAKLDPLGSKART